MIRIQFVRGWSLIFADNHRAASTCILSLAGWYAYAQREKLVSVTRNRYNDYVTALYAMLDYEAQSTPCIFTDSAALLLKRVDFDPFRVCPTWLSSWAEAEGISAKASKAPFSIPRLVEAQKRLGKTGAFIDIVMTDNRLHLRVLTLDGRRHIRDLLADTNRPVPQGESPRGIKYITPTSVILVPVRVPEIEEEFRTFANAREVTQRVPEEGKELATGFRPNSEVIHWEAIFRDVYVHQENGKWAWKFNWSSLFYERSDDFWQTLYNAIYAKVIPDLEKKGIGHLVISPDGSLTSLPHHLLRDPSGRRLCDKFLVSYSPNLLAGR